MKNIVYLHLLRNDYLVTIGISRFRSGFYCKKIINVFMYMFIIYCNDENVMDSEFGSLVEIKDNYP